MASIKLEIPDEFAAIAPNLAKSLSKELQSYSDVSAPDLHFLEPLVVPEPPKVHDNVITTEPVEVSDEVEFKTPAPAPENVFGNIRARDDGSYVVELTTPVGILDYHVTKPEFDPYGKPGLYASVLAAIKEGANVAPWENPAAPEPSDEDKLSWAKAEAKHTIELLQFEFDVADTSERKILGQPLQEWKRYRLDLEKIGLVASKPDKPKWIKS